MAISNMMQFSFTALLLVLVGMTVLSGCGDLAPKSNWQAKLGKELPVLGHRNWILVADSAYPAQSKPAIDTIYTDSTQLEVVEAVLTAIEDSDHVRPVIYLDEEMQYVTEKAAPGIDCYKKQLDKLLSGKAVQVLPHDELIAKLDKDAEVFNILVLKTDLAIPYTSVFFQLDCGYWSADKEKALREAFGEK